MALFIFLSTAAWARIISANFRTNLNWFLFYIFGRIYVIIFLWKIFWAATSAGKFFFALAHFTHVGFSFSFFLYSSTLVLFNRYAAMSNENYNVFIYFIIQLLECVKGFDLINHQWIFLFVTSG